MLVECEDCVVIACEQELFSVSILVHPSLNQDHNSTANNASKKEEEKGDRRVSVPTAHGGKEDGGRVGEGDHPSEMEGTAHR